MKPTAVCALLCISALIGCKKDGPVGPETLPTLPASASAVIGSAGGSLTTKGFSLIVPPGAFAGTETLKVTGETYDDAFGTRAVTGVFRLEGIPSSFAKSLELKLESVRTPSQGIFIALGREATCPGSGEARLCYVPLVAVKDSTFLKATLLPDSTGGTHAPLRKSTTSHGLASQVAWLLGVDEQAVTMSSFGHFKLFYPRYLESGATNLAAALENAYSAFFQMGFDRTAYDRVPWPMHVFIRNMHVPLPLPPGELLSGHLPGLGESWMGMDFEEDAVLAGDLPTIQRAAGQVFCTLFFTVNDPLFSERFTPQLLQTSRNRIWPYYAVGAWAGEIFAPAGTGGGAPLNFRLQRLCPLDGLTISTGEKPWAHGLGLSPLIHYMADTHTPNAVFQLFYAIPSAEHAIDALKSTLPVPEREWWPGFLKEYLSGSIYNMNSDDLLTELSSPASSRVFTIEDPTDTLKTFSDAFTDLSARLYRVNLRYSGMDTSALIRFSAGPSSLGSQYVGVMLFGLKNKTLSYWQYANSVTVGHVKDLTASGYDVVAAVVNCLNESPYGGSRTIELTVSVESGVGRPMSASFHTRLKGTETSDAHTGPGTMFYSSGFKKGIMAGGIFTASWSETSPDFPSGMVTVTGELTIQLDGAAPPAGVVRFSAKETILHSAYNREVWEVTSSDNCRISAYWEYNRYVHRITGVTARNQVASVANRYDSFTDGYWRSFSNPSGDEQDFIEIIIE